MVFLDYEQIDLSFGSSTSNLLVYTTTYRCMIVPEPKNTNPNGVDTISLWVEDDGTTRRQELFFQSASTGDTRTLALGSGKNIRASANSTTNEITLHVFRLPDADS